MVLCTALLLNMLNFPLNDAYHIQKVLTCLGTFLKFGRKDRTRWSLPFSTGAKPFKFPTRSRGAAGDFCSGRPFLAQKETSSSRFHCGICECVGVPNMWNHSRTWGYLRRQGQIREIDILHLDRLGCTGWIFPTPTTLVTSIWPHPKGTWAGEYHLFDS